MANENMEEYRTGPAIIDETVRVAKKYLEEHPEELKSLTEAMDDVKRVRIGSPKTEAQLMTYIKIDPVTLAVKAAEHEYFTGSPLRVAN